MVKLLFKTTERCFYDDGTYKYIGNDLLEFKWIIKGEDIVYCQIPTNMILDYCVQEAYQSYLVRKLIEE